MSKYIKLEDVIHNLNMVVVGRTEYTEKMKADLFFAIDNLPTIEVSEDAIIEIKTRYVPLLAPNEDCISRKYLFSKVYDMDNDDLVVDLKDIENAPSVIPKPKEGEWIVEEKYSLYGKKKRLTCSKCGDVFDATVAELPYERYCRYCGAKMKGAGEW